MEVSNGIFSAPSYCISSNGFLPSTIANISGIMPLFSSGFIAVSTAIINDLPFALFNSSIFLSNDGPAATTIAGISLGITSASCLVLYPSSRKCALANIFCAYTAEKRTLVLIADAHESHCFLIAFAYSIISSGKIL